jgi:4-azaleucine resistance transporter AzlC
MSEAQRTEPAVPRETTNSTYWQGVRDGTPFLLVVAPFSMLFGVVAVEAGLDVLQALGFSVVVIAGAAQFTAVQLLDDGAPTAIALISALAVNLRMAMYSASLTPWLGETRLWQRAFVAFFTTDPTYACSMLTFERKPEWTPAHRLAYFFGVITPVAPTWYGSTLVGALLGSAIPDTLALDFSMPIIFLAMIGPMLRTPAHMAAAAVAVVMALVLAFLPFNLGTLAAGLIAMITGARIEVVLERRAARRRE